MEGALPGSPVHGEHPKFAVVLEESGTANHVLVKFSPPANPAVGQRWSDLLVTEHLAHKVLNGATVAAARSRIHQIAGRTYLEVDRFDRAGLDGRVGVTSLSSIDSALYDKLDNWIESTGRLRRARYIDAATLECVRLVSTFGSLIANTDRHRHLRCSTTTRETSAWRRCTTCCRCCLRRTWTDHCARVRPAGSGRGHSARLRARLLAERSAHLCARWASARIPQDCAKCLATLEALPHRGLGG